MSEGGAGHGGGHAGAKRSFPRHLLSAAPVLVLVTAATTLLSHHGALRGFETSALDVWLRVQAPRSVSDVVLVTIDDEDYRELFGRRSPLRPGAVRSLVEAVLAGGPRVVGVDLDTSDEEYAATPPPEGSAKVVWAREGIADEHEGAAGAHGEAPRFHLGPVLGREGEAARGIESGLALMPQDPDGLIRRYRHALPIVGEGGHTGEMDTLGFAIVRALPEGASRTPSEHALVLNFAGDRYAFPKLSARDVIAGARTPAWASAGPLHGKIVIVGGTYRAARDEYITPVGAMPGVQLVAQAVESELHGGGIRPLAHWLMLVFEVISGLLLVWINYRFQLRSALLLSLLAMPIAALCASLLSFSSLAYWFDFVPTLLGVFIHELIDHTREYHAMHTALHGAGHAPHAAAPLPPEGEAAPPA